MIDDFSLGGKTAIITGAGRGIGKSIALAMAESGCDVALVSRTEKQLRESCDYISSFYPSVKCISIASDITEVSEVGEIVSEVESQFGKIDILVNCAGVFVMKPFLSGMDNKMDAVPDFNIPMTAEEWQIQMDTNVTGAFNLTSKVAVHMAARKSGKIIFISSIDAIKGMSYHSAYAATKGAIISLAKNLAVELGRYSINVNCICPGFVHTDMTDFAHKDERMRNVMVNMSPFRRVTTPRDVALLAVFLSSSASDCITGQIICVDCGVTC